MTAKTTSSAIRPERQQYEGGRSDWYNRYPNNKLKFPATGGTLVCKADTTLGSRSFYIATIGFENDSYSLTYGGYYYSKRREAGCDFHVDSPKMDGYPAHWEPCPLTFRWVTVILDGYDLKVTLEPNETDKERYCYIVVADMDDFWQVECTQAKGPYKPKKPKKQAQ